jgi:diacylglycerol kinase (ATP)
MPQMLPRLATRLNSKDAGRFRPAHMRIVVLFNPVSGSGRAQAAARQLSVRLSDAGHDVRPVATRTDLNAHQLADELAGAQLVVVAGGDGAVRMAAEAAARLGVPIYHFPCGTENLFAREFGMTRSASQLIDSINRFNVCLVDMASANGEAFVLMASVGYDAEVVYELACRRGPTISHLSYVWPMLKQLLLWRPPELHIAVDDRILVEGCRGQVVIANCRQYAWRLNPAPAANMRDGLLDVVFFPAESKLEILTWTIRCARRTHAAHSELIQACGKHVKIWSPSGPRYQLDGDPPRHCEGHGDGSAQAHAKAWSLEVQLHAGTLPVLMPTTGQGLGFSAF